MSSSTTPFVADERRGHRARGGVRRRRHLHRDPGVRRRPPAVPRPPDRGVHADDRVRHRPEGRPAGRAPAGRGRRARPRSTSTCRQAGTSDWDLLQRLAADVGFDITVREGKFGFGPPAEATGSTRRGRTASHEPAGPAAGRRPAAVPGGGDLRRTGQGGGGPRLGHRDQAAADRDRSGGDGGRVPPRRRPGPAREDLRGRPVRRDRRAAPHAGRGGHGLEGAGRDRCRVVRRVRGCRPRQPGGAGGRPDHPRQRSAPRSTASTPSPRHGTGSTRPPATPRPSR